MKTVYRPVPGFVDLYAGMDSSIVHAERGELEQKLYRNSRYLQVIVPNHGQQSVHVLMAAAYLGKRETGMQVRHGDDIKTHNTPGNLCYGTPKDNTQDAVKAGSHASLIHATKTRCINDHEFTPENTYIPPGTNWRQCRTCRKNNEAKRGIPKQRRITKADMKRARAEQWRATEALIEELFQSKPPLSDRAIARIVGVGHPTVARRRHRINPTKED